MHRCEITRHKVNKIIEIHERLISKFSLMMTTLHWTLISDLAVIGIVNWCRELKFAILLHKEMLQVICQQIKMCLFIFVGKRLGWWVWLEASSRRRVPPCLQLSAVLLPDRHRISHRRRHHVCHHLLHTGRPLHRVSLSICHNPPFCTALV